MRQIVDQRFPAKRPEWEFIGRPKNRDLGVYMPTWLHRCPGDGGTLTITREQLGIYRGVRIKRANVGCAFCGGLPEPFASKYKDR